MNFTPNSVEAVHTTWPSKTLVPVFTIVTPDVLMCVCLSLLSKGGFTLFEEHWASKYILICSPS